MRALNIEDSIADLRFDKVILATDADVDGLHIRNLLFTFFLHYFEPLVKLGHVYILETPIFRVRNKRKHIYCYSDERKDAAIRKLQGKGKQKKLLKQPALKVSARYHRRNLNSLLALIFCLDRSGIDSVCE